MTAHAETRPARRARADATVRAESRRWLAFVWAGTAGYAVGLTAESLYRHHVARPWSGFAAAFGVRRLSELALNRVVGGVAVGVAAALALVVGLSQHDVWNQGQFLQRDAVRDGLARIPADASVAATIHLDPHLSQRRELYALPEPFVPWNWGSPLSHAEVRQKTATLDYVAYYDGDGPLPYVRRALPLLRREGFVQIYSRGPMRVYQRRSTNG